MSFKAINYGSTIVLAVGHHEILHDHTMWPVIGIIVGIRLFCLVRSFRMRAAV